ncbi:glycosyltransferase [Paenibacillus sinopodophylli]|uniref:glycosyltransferase n=1 Tax=Paenibacillus sinopodophylli TaxID=1837342 RepID=UPI00110D0581|nr:glycosyltransferase [Paenibacillus sinopodophylli]
MLHMIWDALCVLLGFVLFQPIWWKKQSLSPAHREDSQRSTVISDRQVNLSVIIPARNEAANLQVLLPMLDQQNLKPMQIIVVDDGSEDATEETAEALGAIVVKAPPLPAGWIGKSWACWSGAHASSGEWLLFLDADTKPSPAFIDAMYSQLLIFGGMVSVQPVHEVPTFREQCSAFFNLVITAGSGASAWLPLRTDGFGPCAACRRTAYFDVGGHERVRGDILEHLTLGKRFKEAGHRSTLLLGQQLLQFRMYPEGWRSLVQGWSKSIGKGAGATPALLLAIVIIWMSGLASAAIRVISCLQGEPLNEWLFAILLYIAGIVTVSHGLKASGTFKWYTSICYPAYLFFFAALFSYSLILSFIVRKVSWKGRQIDVP